MKTVRQFLIELAESEKELNVNFSIRIQTLKNTVNFCMEILYKNKIIKSNIDCCFSDYELDNYKVITAIEMNDCLYLKVELIENKTDKEIDIL